MNSPTFLVLVATCNGSPWLREQLDSVSGQEDVDLQILVSDDGSTDGTLDVLSAYARERPNVKILPSIRPSGSACANFLRLIRDADASQADYVALCDQDDIWHPSKLARAVSQIRSDGASLYSAAVTTFRDGERTQLLTQVPAQRAFDFLFEGAGQGCTFVLTAAFFTQIQSFVRSHASALIDLRYHDWLIYALGRTWSTRWTYDIRPSMLYRQHGRNDTGARGNIASLRKRLALVRSGWYRRQMMCILEACMIASPQDPRWKDFRKANGPASVGIRSFGRAGWLLLHSRRRLQDRIALTIFSLAGLI